MSHLNTPVPYTYTYIDSSVGLLTHRFVLATPIQIRFQSTDSSVVPIPTDPTRPLGQNELSTAAKAGLGFGLSVAGLVLLGMGFFFGRRYRAARMPRRQDTIPLQSQDDRPPSYDEVATKR
jgi:hypothetical protein